MAFVAEDGTGLANSNSYATVAGADTYFTDRAIAAWTGADNVKEVALIKATDYINSRFRFLGSKYDEDQALEWPRVLVYGGEAEMPATLLKATYEYAVRALSAVLAPDPTVDDRGMQIKSKAERVGPISEETVYVDGGGITRFRPYPAADILLRDLIVNSRRVIR